MLDLKFIRENPDLVKKGIEAKGIEVSLGELLRLDGERREILQKVEILKRERNQANEEISRLKKEGKGIQKAIRHLKSKSQKIDEFDGKVGEIDSEIVNMLYNIPNIPHPSVPVGNAKKNQVVRTAGAIPRFSFKPRDHIELAESLGWLSFGRASKIAGHGFALFQGEGARLERALFNFMVDLHGNRHAYTEIFPPFLVNRKSMMGTGQLPKLEQDMYRLKDDDYFLIPTAEVPVTNLHRDEILEEEELPKKYVAYTACFRREAGSYGRQTKGLIRVHQFDKVELVKFAHPDRSDEELETLLQDAEEVLKLLGLPYRVVLLATGELSFAGAKCYDLEVWSPAREEWLEVSSCSNFTDFQARRINVKFRPKGGGKPRYVHTLNASGVALARTVVGILENTQQEDGTVRIPEVLKPYLR